MLCNSDCNFTMQLVCPWDHDGSRDKLGCTAIRKMHSSLTMTTVKMLMITT